MVFFSWVLALLAGLAQAAAMAFPLTLERVNSGQPLWLLQLISLGLLAHLLLKAPSARRAAFLGWLFATAWLAGSFWWLFISMHTYGGLAAPLAALAVLALAIGLGSYYAVACGVFWRLRSRWKRATPLCATLLFAALWLLAELARGAWFTGLPWGAGGYAHVDGPFNVLARWIGVYGISAVVAALAMLLNWLPERYDYADRSVLLRWAAVVVLGFAWLGLNAQRGAALREAEILPSLSLTLLQGNIPQNEKFEHGSGVPQALDWYGEQVRAATADLVIAPETAIPLLPQQLDPDYLASISQRYTHGAQALLIGIPLGDSDAGYTNSVMGFVSGQQHPYRYDKHHLVPFGEFIPPLFRWFTDLMHIPLGDFARGGLGQPPLHWQGQRIAPHICYEDLFGEEMAAHFQDADNAPTLLVNLSNIGWFGNSIAIDQHLNISRMRALEFERPLVRATNTGATAVIDAQGRVTHQLAAHTRGVLHAEVQGRAGPVTPYAWWTARWGLWPLWLLALCIVLWCAVCGQSAATRANTG